VPARILKTSFPFSKTILSVLAVLFCIHSFAAFPVPSTPPLSEQSATQVNVKKKTEEPIAAKEHKKARNYSTTLGLCAVFGLLGVHRFYLGYYWQGFLQLFITAAFLSAILALAPSLIFGLALLTITVLPMLGLILWVIVDFLRILQKTLLPKNGYYQ
jgi:hypothetical protein